jgi:hypothetical protein
MIPLGGHLKLKNSKGNNNHLLFAASVASNIDPQTVLQSVAMDEIDLKQKFSSQDTVEPCRVTSERVRAVASPFKRISF